MPFVRCGGGRIIYKGKAHETNLGVPIRGKVPLDANGKIALSAKGDTAFERSRDAATKALEAWRKETRASSPVTVMDVPSPICIFNIACILV